MFSKRLLLLLKSLRVLAEQYDANSLLKYDLGSKR